MNSPGEQDLPPHLRELAAKLTEAERDRQVAVAAANAKSVSSWPILWVILAIVSGGVLAGGVVLSLTGMPRAGIEQLPWWMAGAANLFAFGILATILGAIFLARVRALAADARNRTEKTTGIIVSTELEKIPAGSRPGYLYRVVVAYQYEAGGQTLHGMFRPSLSAHNSMSRHESMRQRFSPGSTLRIAYNPNALEDSGPAAPPSGRFLWSAVLAVGSLLLSAALVLGYMASQLVRSLMVR